MDYFTNQPAEKIEEICKRLDNKSLSKFMETSKRIHSICYDMYLKRQEEYLEEKKIEDEMISNLSGDTLSHVTDSLIGSLRLGYTYNSLDEYLADPFNRFNRNYIYIPKLKIISKPNIVRVYLEQGLNQKTIYRLMKTAIKI